MPMRHMLLEALLKLLLLVLLLPSFPVVSSADQSSPKFAIQSISTDDIPKVDGELSDSIWRSVVPISEFHQTRPDDHGTASQRTEVQIVKTSETLYLAFRAHDSDVSRLTAKGLIQGETFFSDDRVSVNLDTFGDRRNSYFFQVNPNGIRREALVGNDYFIDDWDTIWHASAKVNQLGWTAEMAIPLKSIAFDPNTEIWGINFGRELPSRGESVAWSSIDRNSGPSAFGSVSGMVGFSQGHGLEITPSVSIGSSYQESTDRRESIVEPSVTGFYNITPNLTAGLTLNTDFSGTEADQRQINLGRFSLFFPEKRDFFLRDASIFEFGGLETNARPFFSRRVGLSDDGDPLDLETGIKLTGRSGDWNVGSLLIKQQTLDSTADDTLFVGRVTRNVFRESEVGLITTVGDPNSDSNNRLTGIDYTYRNSTVFGDQSLRTNIWYQETDSEGVNKDQSAFGLRVSYPNYKYSGYLDLSRVEDNFNPALGFVNRTGVDQVRGRLRRRFQLENSYFDWVGTRVQYFRSDRIGGGIQTERKQLNLIEGFSGQNDFFTIFAIDQTEGIEESFTLPGDLEVSPGLYNYKRYGFFAETGEQRVFSGVFLYGDGDFFNGERRLIETRLNWRPNKHFFGSISIENNDLKINGKKASNRLYTARANVALNSKWAWLNLVQGDNVSESVSLNSRLRYQPRPDREFFLIFDHSVDRANPDNDDTSLIFKASFNYQL